MSVVSNEVAFLRKFRVRFVSNLDYKKALKDMMDEGLITRVAYNKVVKSKSTTTSQRKSVAIKRPRKRTDERIQIADSCGGSASYSSSC